MARLAFVFILCVTAASALYAIIVDSSFEARGSVLTIAAYLLWKEYNIDGR